MTLHFTFDPLSSPSLPSPLGRDAGHSRVEIGCSPQALRTRLGTLRSWLRDRQMPYRLDIERHIGGLQIVVRFPEAAHAHACQIEFGGRFAVAEPDPFPGIPAGQPSSENLITLSNEVAGQRPWG